MTGDGQLLPERPRIQKVESPDTPIRSSAEVIFTRDHEMIRRWAEERRAQPATGEATGTGPATASVNDGGAGIRFNFPGTSLFRPITWDEWLSNFNEHDCAFVYDHGESRPLSTRYRIVKASDWEEFLEADR